MKVYRESKYLQVFLLLVTVQLGLFFSPAFAEAAIYFEENFNDSAYAPLSKGSNWLLMSDSGYGNSPAMKLRYWYNSESDNNTGTAGNALNLNVESLGRNDFYIQFKVKRTGAPKGGSKFLKIFGAACSNGNSCNNHTFGLNYWSNNQSEVAYYGDTICTARYDGTQVGCSAWPLNVYSTSAPVYPNSDWHTYEYRLKRAAVDQSDGVLQFWLDGVLQYHATGVHNNPSGDLGILASPYIESIEWGGYTHQISEGNLYSSGDEWELWVDDIVVADSYIGTGQTDATPPSLSAPSSLGTLKNKTPSFSFTSDEAGTITYGGSCSSATATATVGENAITLNALNVGTHSNCEITVTDSSGNVSTPLTIPMFHITYPGDLDLNRNVNIFDYNILLTNFGQTYAGDPDGDGDMDIFDYNLLIGDFGKSF